MVNTPNNSTERIPSNNGGNKFKKGIAALIALTLYGQPTEGKTYEKQEFPTEIVANNPGEVSPMTENVEQSTVPNYINRAQNGVRKYYPQYEEYFKPIFSELRGMGGNAINIFNKKIHENFDTFEEELTTEKDKCATILITIDNLLGEKKFTNGKKSVNTTEGEDLLKGIADEITFEIKAQFSKKLRESRENLNNSREKLNKINRIVEEMEKNNNPEGILKAIEEFFEITNINDVKSDKTTQNIVKHYISIGNKINWRQSSLGKKFIEEYKKIQ